MPASLSRRTLLTGSLAAPAATLAARRSVQRSQLSFIGDEVGAGVQDWIGFAKEFRLRQLELRGFRRASGATFAHMMPPGELKAVRRQLDDAGLRVSFLNSILLKFTLPGTLAVGQEEWYENYYKAHGLSAETLYANRFTDLMSVLDAAEILGTRLVRTFSYWRVAEPVRIRPRLIDDLVKMGDLAARRRCVILLETEGSTNCATCREARELFDSLHRAPGLGINWDPQNSLALEPDTWPNGYGQLPVERIQNIQIKADGLFGDHQLPWAEIFHRVSAEGYRGAFGLETHHGSGAANWAMSRRCMAELIRIIGESV